MLQETALTLSLLYSVKFNDNKYYRSKYIKELAIAQIYYWMKIQNRNGSFDEFFPMEESFVATAFTLYSSCLSIKLLNEDPTFIRDIAFKACQFLSSYGNPGASNQIAAAIAGMNQYSDLFSDTSFNTTVKKLVDVLLESQSDEGWTPEYGGFDTGYQSITLGWLSDYNSKKKDKRINDSLVKIIEFLSNFIHPDGTIGGEYGSRSTSFLAPHGFAFNIGNTDLASSFMRKIFIEDSKVNNSIDDRYICHFLLPSYLLSIKSLTQPIGKTVDLPCRRNFSKVFNDAGIIIKSKPKYYFICSLKKNGVFQLYNKTVQGSIYDAGYVAKIGKTLAVTNWLNPSVQLEVKDNHLTINGHFFRVSNRIPNPIYHVILRIITFFGRNKVLPILKKYFITRDKSLKGIFKRSIYFEEDKIKILDEISLMNKNQISIYESNPHTTFRYVAPSNYFHYNELENFPARDEIVIFSNGKRKISKIIDLSTFKIKSTFD